MIHLIKNVEPMHLTHYEESLFQQESRCHICNKPFNIDENKVRDHCHLTGNFRGAAHNGCNLQYQIPFERFQIPIFFHNGKKYDFDLFIKKMGEYTQKIEVIPQNIESYM